MKTQKKGRVAVGMSGGVDSSVAAAILREQGYNVTGVFMECWNEPGCRTDEDRKDALRVATRLGIRFQVLDFRNAYREKIVEDFYDSYARGLTPNPDIVCNREIKFGLFDAWAKEKGYDFIATGHYARIAGMSNFQTPNSKQLLSQRGSESFSERGLPSLFLQRGKDASKDQSYFLYEIGQEQLARTLFPLGELLKRDVREKARSLGLHVQDKPDSMGVCFMGGVDVQKLLRKRLGEQPGEVVFRGQVVGEHRGLWFYTIGSRGGFTIDKKKLISHVDPSSLAPLYVIRKDVNSNRLFIGFKDEAFTDTFTMRSLHWTSPVWRSLERRLFVRVRNLGELVACTITDDGDRVDVACSRPLFGVAEGQSGVLYLHNGASGDEIVVGGGVIAKP